MAGTMLSVLVGSRAIGPVIARGGTRRDAHDPLHVRSRNPNRPPAEPAVSDQELADVKAAKGPCRSTRRVDGAWEACRRAARGRISPGPGTRSFAALLAGLAYLAAGCDESTARAAHRGDILRGIVGDSRIDWFFETQGPVVAQPIARDGVVFCGSTDHRFYALSARTGQPIWRFQAGNPIRTPAALEGDVAYFGSEDGLLYALDAVTGNQRWVFKSPAPLAARPLAASGIVCLGAAFPAEDRLLGVESATGHERWELSCPGRLAGAPMEGGDCIYATSARENGGSLFAVGAWSGTLLWQLDFPRDSPATAPCLGDGVAYTGTRGGALVAADLQKRKVRWEANAGKGGVRGTPVADADTVFAADGEGCLRAFSAATGKPRWRFTLRSPIAGAICLSDGILYCGDEAGNVVAVDAATGIEKWRYRASPSRPVTPSIAEGVIYFGTNRGKIFALPTY
jgi:eukaryotic-like serine/threonine-protein kinase